jgi:broad specificity phosphatase PhoE
MRVVLLCHGSTSAVRTAAFAGDEPLEPAARAQVAALAGALPRVDLLRRAPSTRCRQTAEVLGLDAAPDDRLAGCDFGAWAGRTLDEVVATDPDGVTAWLTDPAARPHGGESLATLLRRVGRWLDEAGTSEASEASAAPRPARALLALADPTVIRAAVVHALDARPRSIWRIDVAPLSRTVLVGSPGRWSLRSLSR